MSTYIKQMLGPYMLNKYLDTFMFNICILCIPMPHMLNTYIKHVCKINMLNT